jgi:elongation factor Ts
MGKDRPTISAAQVKALRDATGAGMMDCKRALEEAGGDGAAATEILRTRGLAGVEKRAGKEAREGVIGTYLHHNARVGVLVEVNSETDFVANTDEFRALAKEIALHVASMDPRWVRREDVPPDVVERESRIAEAKAREMGRPEQVIPRVVEGMVGAFYKDHVLLEQPYVRDDSRTVADLVNDVAAKVNEKVAVRRFARFKVGEVGEAAADGEAAS